MPESSHRSSGRPTPRGSGFLRLRTMVLLAVLLAVALVPVTACSSAPEDAGAAGSLRAALTGVSVDVHKEVGCGCCDVWVAHLRAQGATVAVADDPNLADHREQLGVPAEAAGCHTAVIDGFVVEGHVPVSAIVRFSADRPQAVGVAVPGMPSDGPGMGGDEASWNAMNVLLVLHDGGLAPFEF